MDTFGELTSIGGVRVNFGSDSVEIDTLLSSDLTVNNYLTVSADIEQTSGDSYLRNLTIDGTIV